MKKYFKYVLCACLVIVLHVTMGMSTWADETVPMLKEVKQVASNKLQITYDKPVDQAKATDISNYWIQSLESQAAVGIASLGKEEKVNAGNALTGKKAKIAPVGSSETQVEITFREPITPGGKYKLIICYVSAPGAGQYDGDNGTVEFVGQK